MDITVGKKALMVNAGDISEFEKVAGSVSPGAFIPTSKEEFETLKGTKETPMTNTEEKMAEITVPTLSSFNNIMSLLDTMIENSEGLEKNTKEKINYLLGDLKEDSPMNITQEGTSVTYMILQRLETINNCIISTMSQISRL